MTGRKLLLADDSVTIQKVIDLTFSDEGLEVTTVGDGQQAIQKLEESTPDIVLADVLMPGLDGYGLCEFIKKSERFRGIPVMLLVGSFEPFDEAEARRVGADDVLTKPFQSIKQLISRVGLLLGGKTDQQMASGLSTLGLAQTVRPSRGGAVETNVPPETGIEVTPPVEESKECDIEMQTADTLKLRPVEAMSASAGAPLHNNFEAQPVNILTAEKDATLVTKDDVLLDLDNLETGAASSEIDDSILDLEYIEAVELAGPVPAPALESSLAPGPVAATSEAEWKNEAAVEERAAEPSIAAREFPASPLATTELSAEAVEAIAQRVVEKLSDKVVREIAWEVVPELAELLIKQRLEEQQRPQ